MNHPIQQPGDIPGDRDWERYSVCAQSQERPGTQTPNSWLGLPSYSLCSHSFSETLWELTGCRNGSVGIYHAIMGTSSTQENIQCGDVCCDPNAGQAEAGGSLRLAG